MARTREERDRAEFLLKQGMPVGQVAAEMGIPVTTISTWHCEMKSIALEESEESPTSDKAWQEVVNYKNSQKKFAEQLEHLSDKLYDSCCDLLDQGNEEEPEGGEGLTTRTHRGSLPPRFVNSYIKSYIELGSAASECRRRVLAAEHLISDAVKNLDTYDYSKIKSTMLKNVKL